MNLLKKNLNGGVKGSLAGLFVVCSIFGLSNRIGHQQSFTSHILSVITDHYYLLYFMIPLFLLLCFFIVEDDSEMVVLRYKTYFKYFVSKWSSMIVISLIFMVIQLIAIGISGIGLSMSSGWETESNGVIQEVFEFYSKVFVSPLLSFIASAAYMLVGLSIVTMILMWISHFVSKSNTIKIVIFIYFLSVANIKISFLQSLRITTFNHIIILHHSLSSPTRFVITVVTIILLMSLILWMVKKRWNHKLYLPKRHLKGITPYYIKELINKKNVVILSSIVTVMLLWKYLQRGQGLSAEAWIVSMFSGHGTGSFHAFNFIEMILLNGSPLYLMIIFIEKMTTEHSTFVTIRLNKRREMLAGLLKAILLFIFVYGTLLTVIPVIGLVVIELPIDTSILSLIGLSVGLKMLDILVQALFILGIYCLTGQTTPGFMGLIGVNLLSIAPIKYLPFGLSSLSRFNLPQFSIEGIPILHVLIILLNISVLLITWLFTVGYKYLPRD